MAKPIDIRFLYEHKAREMEAIALLAAELEKRGATTEIRPCNGMGKKRVAPASVLVVPYCRTNRDLKHYGRFGKGSKAVVSLQWEQIYTYEMDEKKPCPLDPAEEAVKAIHFCWGEHTRRREIADGISPELLKLTGPLQLDLCRPQFRGLYLSKEAVAQSCGLDSSKKWLLICSNFSGELERSGGDAKAYSDGIAGERAQCSSESKKIIIPWVVSYIERHPEWTVVYRPHPFEKSDQGLMELSRHNPNFVILDSYSARQWMAISDKQLFWISTSAVEAHAMGKDYAIVRPTCIPRSIDMTVYENCNWIASEDQFIAYMNSSCRWNEWSLDDDVVNRYYQTESPAFLRAADVLQNILIQGVVTSINLEELTAQTALKEKFAHSFLFDIYERFFSFLHDSGMFPLLSRVRSIKQKADDAHMRCRDQISDKEFSELKQKIREDILPLFQK